MEALMTTVGSGSYQYEVVESWAKLPAGWTWGPVSAVATDSQDRVYAFKRKDPPIVVSDGDRNSRVHRFSAQGALLSSWGTPGKQEPGEFHLPHSLWVDPEGFVYVCDRENSRIQVFNGSGKFVSQWRDIHRPTDIYFNARQVAYVSELRPSISILDRNGKVLARFDSPSGHGLWVDSVGDIYLAEAGGKRLTKYVHER